MTYELRVKSNPDSDIQPRVASLVHPLVKIAHGIDTDRVRVVINDQDADEYEAVMNKDRDVYEWQRVEAL